MLIINNARINARQVIKESVTDDLWKRNEAFSIELVDILKKHRLSHHPIYTTTNKLQSMSQDWAKWYHLECGRAFMEVIMDAYIKTVDGCIQLQPRLGIKAVYNARFLLQITLVDELGFIVRGEEGYSVGNPNLSHFIQFIDVLAQLGISVQDLETYQLTEEGLACRRFIVDNYNDYLRLISVLAMANTVFTNTFFGEWIGKVGKLSGIDVSQGYYSIVASEDDTVDMWYLFRQAVTPERYDEIRALTVDSLNTWAGWLDRLLSKL